MSRPGRALTVGYAAGFDYRADIGTVPGSKARSWQRDAAPDRGAMGRLAGPIRSGGQIGDQLLDVAVAGFQHAADLLALGDQQ